MKYSILTLFPEFFTSPLSSSLIAKAQEKGLVSFSFHNPRDFATDKHKSVDDTPYGGGAGMLMALPPLVQCLESIVPTTKKIRYIALSPDGEKFTQEKAEELAKEEELVLLCGRYEGFDARLFDIFPIEKISVGDFVLNGGESAALCLIEASARLLPNFMGKEQSFIDESFGQSSLLEYPHYTKPPVFREHEVPSVLLSGNHQEIEKFRAEEALKKTLLVRPDIIEDKALTKQEQEYLKNTPRIKKGRNLSLCLLHHPVLLKNNDVGTSSITNLDIHDIARSACSYDVARFYAVTPIEDQAKLIHTLTDYWTKGQGAIANKDRKNALSLVRHAYSWEDAQKEIEKETGVKPLLVGTSAQIPHNRKGKALVEPTSWKSLKKMLNSAPILLLFGTSHGIPNFLLTQCDALLPPIRGLTQYNHLSVRAAVALCLDRLLGETG